MPDQSLRWIGLFLSGAFVAYKHVHAFQVRYVSIFLQVHALLALPFNCFARDPYRMAKHH